MATIDWKKFTIPYEQAIDELKIKFRSIRKECKKRGTYSPIEFVTGRVKEMSSLLEKANKFDIPLERIQYEIEDIAGLRIMCQFVDDIDKVIDIIRKRQDMQIIYEKDYVDNVKNSGYRSYHIIIKYPVNMSDGVKVILAELQVRTLAMNFWATIEHSLNYKYKHNIPPHIKKKLKSAADAAFRLDQEMLEIKEEIKDAQKLFGIKSSLVSDIMQNIELLSSVGKSSEAARFRKTLDSLIEEGNIIQFSELLSTTEKTLHSKGVKN
ncbi:GTP pyrophosphokinase [Oceanirhabdus seepicola]|uniref:GTP pyrophosphokinase family protein n=1 Tax=Oceanirhabdus seepicola TaxID=2828781 RepID=A0A9J6P1G1_9CLOT|nr:GTP pyrophosphokinase family protein [Oceanirhabdus seepicola]MCM1990379.1 GTP pyrophosphokinase family protein [Oceanirhabdus seepicola]